MTDQRRPARERRPRAFLCALLRSRWHFFAALQQ
jgi:hypothetical protein